MIKFINNKKENDNLYSFLKWSKEESKKLQANVSLLSREVNGN